jgi:serine/threonine protein kinase
MPTPDPADTTDTILDSSLTRDDVDTSERRIRAKPESVGAFHMLGRFEILRELGRGGMGRVFKAWDPARGEQVAVKVLLGFNSAAFFRFKREFRSLAEVSHPNLVKLHELFFEDGRLFFSMELLEGVDFVRYLGSFGDGGGPRVWPTLRQLVEGVHALHQAGKLHRDIKPSNIIVTKDDRVVLLDFGLIREKDDPDDDNLTAPGAVIGTPAYMSPEQASGLPIGPQSDWYAVGLVLWEALTGKRPFEDKSPARLMRARLVREPPPPSTEQLGIPPDIDELCGKLLKRQPDDRPSPDELLQAVGATASHTPTPPEKAITGEHFVGRTGELDTLRHALNSVSHGSPVCVFVNGPSGIGKSELIRHFLQENEHDISVVLSGRCFERESVPYKAFDLIVDQLAERLRRLEQSDRDEVSPPGMDALARLFPVLGRVASVSRDMHSWETAVDGKELRARAFAALRDVFTHLALEGQLVVTIDDLQWCDLDSIALLLELLQPPNAPAMLMVSSHRSEQVDTSPALKALFRALDSDRYPAETHDMRLEPLDSQECIALAGMMLGPDDTGVIEQAEVIARESDGSPFFVGELVRYAQQRDAQVAKQRAEAALSLEQVISSRIQALPEPAQRILEAIAVAGHRVEQGVALKAALGDKRNRRALDLLRSSNLIRTQGVNDRDWVEPYHDRIRDCVAGGLDDVLRKACHLRLADALAGSSRSDPDVLATHFAQAGASERTVPHALNAARAASKALAFVRAVEWYEVALTHLPAEDASRLDLETELARAHGDAGHGYEAAQAYVRASELTDKTERRELRRRAAHFLVSSGNLAEGREMLGELLASVGLNLPASGRRALLPLLAMRARVALRGLEYEERKASEIDSTELHRIDLCWAAGHLAPFDRLLGGSFFARHLLLALEAGEPGRIAPALAIEATARFMSGSSDFDEAKELLRRAEQVADRSGNDEARAWVANAKPPVFMLAGEWTQAQTQAREAADLLRRHAVGSGVSILTCRYLEIWCRYQTGDWSNLETSLRNLLGSGGKSNPLHWNVRSLLAMPVALANDRPQDAIREFELLDRTPPDEVHGAGEIASFFGTVCAYLYAKDSAAAWKYAQRQRKAMEKALRFRDPLSRSLYQFGRAQAALAQAKRSGSKSTLGVARKALTKLSKQGFRPAPTLATLGRAGLAHLSGETAESEQLLRKCVEDFDGLDMKVHAGVARRRLAQVLGGERGESLVSEAEAALNKLGVAKPSSLVEAFAAGFDPL